MNQSNQYSYEDQMQGLDALYTAIRDSDFRTALVLIKVLVRLKNNALRDHVRYAKKGLRPQYDACIQYLLKIDDIELQLEKAGLIVPPTKNPVRTYSEVRERALNNKSNKNKAAKERSARAKKSLDE